MANYSTQLKIVPGNDLMRNPLGEPVRKKPDSRWFKTGRQDALDGYRPFSDTTPPISDFDYQEYLRGFRSVKAKKTTP